MMLLYRIAFSKLELIVIAYDDHLVVLSNLFLLKSLTQDQIGLPYFHFQVSIHVILLIAKQAIIHYFIGFKEAVLKMLILPLRRYFQIFPYQTLSQYFTLQANVLHQVKNFALDLIFALLMILIDLKT